ncbi:iron chaperone [Demequina aurantiaca]|uniref:iron chaperone n=1 Tax=Demequina aurantiaca TaxID=676200 RepID=UPI003D335E80
METSGTKKGGFSDDEKAAMKERAAEARREAKQAKGAASKAADLQTCLDKIASMEPADRVLAQKVHAIVTATAPDLSPKTWYGMPAYTDADGKVVCFFKDAAKFKSRFCTLGFEDAANIDDGSMWPTSYAIIAIGDAEAKAITALVKRAAS